MIPQKKNNTVFQNSFIETYTYQSGTVPVYGDPPIIRYDEKWVDAGAASGSIVKTNINGYGWEVRGGAGNRITGTIVYTDTYTKPYQGSFTDTNTINVDVTLGQNSTQYVSADSINHQGTVSQKSVNLRQYHKQRTPVYGERPIIRYDPVYTEGTREAWNIRWKKLDV